MVSVSIEIIYLKIYSATNIRAIAINLTWGRPDRFYKPVRSNIGIFVQTKVGSQGDCRVAFRLSPFTLRLLTFPSIKHPLSADVCVDRDCAVYLRH